MKVPVSVSAAHAVLRIDAGSLNKTFTDSAGNVWAVDHSYSGAALRHVAYLKVLH